MQKRFKKRQNAKMFSKDTRCDEKVRNHDNSNYVGPMGRAYFARQIPSDDLNVKCFFLHMRNAIDGDGFCLSWVGFFLP